MKEKLKALFATLPAETRAIYYAVYVSVMAAIDNGDTEVIPHLLSTVRPSSDATAQSEFIAQVLAVIDA